jgi:hypothetical protein
MKTATATLTRPVPTQATIDRDFSALISAVGSLPDAESLQMLREIRATVDAIISDIEAGRE